MALKPPPGHPNAKPVVMFPNQGKGAGYARTSRGEANTLPEGYDRTINMSCIGGRVLTPSLAASTVYSQASPVAPCVIEPWEDANGIPFNIILVGNNSLLHQNNSHTVETDATPRVAISAVDDSAGIPSYTHASTASIQTGDLVNIDTSTQPSFAYSAVASGTGGVARFTTATNYLVTGDLVNISMATGADYSGSNFVVTVVDATHFEIVTAYSATATGTVTLSTKNYNGRNLTVVRVSDTVFTVAAQTFYGTATANVQRENEYASGTKWDDGSGVAYFYAGTKTGRKLLQRRTRAGVWTEPTDAANQKGIFVTAAGGRLWKTINDYQINSFAVGEDPFTATPSAAVWVGTNDAKITALSNIEGRPIPAKEDGIYGYNGNTTQFDRLLKVRFDSLNFPFFADDGAGGLRTATADGVMVHIERFGTITTSLPFQSAPGRDTPRGRVTGIACQGDKIAVMLAPYGKISQPKGLCVLLTTDDGATYTDYTDSMTDQRFDNLLTLTAFDTIANGDWMLVGADSKIALIDWSMIAKSNANARIKIIAALAGAGTIAQTQIIASGSVPGTIFDGTDVSPATTSTPFGKSGAMALSHLVDFGSISWTPGYPPGFSQYGGKYWLIVGLA